MDDARSALSALAKAGMLRSTGVDSYQMHELLRTFALELGRELDDDDARTSAVRRLEALE
jgi:hypothetical protein